MLVEILKPVPVYGEVKRAGVVDVPAHSANHWIATGAARLPVPVVVKTAEPHNPPADSGKPAAESGKRSRF